MLDDTPGSSVAGLSRVRPTSHCFQMRLGPGAFLIEPVIAGCGVDG